MSLEFLRDAFGLPIDGPNKCASLLIAMNLTGHCRAPIAGSTLHFDRRGTGELGLAPKKQADLPWGINTSRSIAPILELHSQMCKVSISSGYIIKNLLGWRAGLNPSLQKWEAGGMPGFIEMLLKFYIGIRFY